MLDPLINCFRIPELRKKIIFTLIMLTLFRLGTYIPLPGVNAELLSKAAGQFGEGALGLIDMFAGGALSNAAIFALGIMPYISASIVFQLLATVIKPLEQLQHEGEAGMRKINQYTRYSTVLLCLIQGYFIMKVILPIKVNDMPVIPTEIQGPFFMITSILALTTGTMLLMWIGEQIQEHGIGNGISLIIMAGIVARMPSIVIHLWTTQVDRASLMNPAEGKIGMIGILGLVVMYVIVVIGVVLLNAGQRRIAIQPAKQIKGKRIFGGQRYYLPLKVGAAGVIPIIFAQSLLMFPGQIVGYIAKATPQGGFWGWLVYQMYSLFQFGSFSYLAMYIILIFFFCFFWTAVQFNPIKMAEQMKEHGSFIPGIRPGERTSAYLEHVMTRVTLAGAAFISVIAIMPYVMNKASGIDLRVTYIYGGTGILIVVGVALDVVQKIENHLLMRHYDGFLKGGTRIRGRQG